MIKIPISKAQEDLPNLVKKSGKRIITGDNGKPAAVLMSINDYESLYETLEILSDQKFMKDIREGLEDMKAGRVYDWENVRKELDWDVSDESHKKS